jgi:hypothetical protein
LSPEGHEESGATPLTVPKAAGVPQSVVQPGVVGVVGVVGVLLADESPQPLRLRNSPSNTDATIVFFTEVVFIACFRASQCGKTMICFSIECI